MRNRPLHRHQHLTTLFFAFEVLQVGIRSRAVQFATILRRIAHSAENFWSHCLKAFVLIFKTGASLALANMEIYSEKLPELHAANILQKELNEAEEYRKQKHDTKMKSATVTRLSDGFKQRTLMRIIHSRYASKYQILWRKAYSAVVMNNLKESFARLTSKMVFIPNDVQLIFRGDKVFYRHSETVTVHVSMYLHTQSHCVEVVSHVLKTAPIDGSTIGLITRSNTENIADTVHTDSHYFIPLPRIYLDYNALLGCVMGTHKQESGLLAHSLNAADEYAQSYQKTLGHHSRSVNLCMDK
eukprot:gene32739-40409_t